MSRNPYPSPLNSSTFSRSAGSTPRFFDSEPGMPPTEMTEEDAIESSLQSTINRLDQAFERIRHLRRDILQEHARNRSLGPSHEAIVLTGQNDENRADAERMRTIVPPDSHERLRQFEARRAEADRERDRNREHDHSHLLRAAAAHMHPLDTSISPSHPSAAQSPLSFASPLSPPRQRLLPHRVLDGQPALRRRESSDDPRTDIGRRVAARESARDSNSSPSHMSWGEHRLPTVIERDFEYSTSTRLRRSEPGFPRRVQPSLMDRIDRLSRSLDANANAAPQSPSAEISNVRLGSSFSRQSSNRSNLPSATTSSSLSLLSNFPVNNFATPSSTLLSNSPLLFEEPVSYDYSEERMQSIDEALAAVSENENALPPNWDGRENLLLFTSSPLQMNREPDARLGHHRDNTVQMQTYARQPLDANGEEIQEYTRPRQQTFSRPSRRHTIDDWGQQRTDVPSRNPHDSGDGIGYTVHLDGPVSIIGSESSVPEKRRTFGTNDPWYTDPLPSKLVDKFTGQSQPARRQPSSLRISTPMVTVGR